MAQICVAYAGACFACLTGAFTLDFPPRPTEGLSCCTASPCAYEGLSSHFVCRNRIPVKGREGQVEKMRTKQNPSRPQIWVPSPPPAVAVVAEKKNANATSRTFFNRPAPSLNFLVSSSSLEPTIENLSPNGLAAL